MDDVRIETRIRQSKTIRRYVPLILIVLVLGGISPVSGKSQPVAPQFHVSAPRTVQLGHPITVVVSVRHAVDVAGYETMLLFDTARAHFNGMQQRRNDLHRLGRDVGPLGAVERPDGVAFGAYSCATASCVDLRRPLSQRAGSGIVTLAALEIVPDQPGELEIRVGTTKVVNGIGTSLPVVLAQERVVVTVRGGRTTPITAPTMPWQVPRPAATRTGTLDLNGDGFVSHADAMEVAVEWTLARERGTPCVSAVARVDINGDGCVDVADLQTLVARMSMSTTSGRRSSAGGAPDSADSAVAAARSFVVTTIADTPDRARGDGRCATTANVCSFRAAIEEANALAGPDTILFNIGETGVQTIALTSRLPIVSDLSGPTTIDGYSQPGSAPNTDPAVSNAQIRVHIQGQGETAFDGLLISSANNVVRGLAWSRFVRAVRLYGSAANDNVIAGNIIGTDPAGTYFATTTVVGASGVHIQQGASRNLIGGTALADRNVISGNGQHGVALYDEATDNNVIVNNLVGLSPRGDRRVPNRSHGVDINTHSSYTRVGGTAAGERNVVSGNGYEGIEISHGRGTMANKVVGNFVGTDVSGVRALSYTANGGYGVHVEDGVQQTVVADNTIGNNAKSGVQIDGFYTSGTSVYGNRVGVASNGTAIPNGVSGVRITYHAQRSRIGPDNVIAFNPVGVDITGDPDNDYHTITRNIMYSNSGLGIDLHPLGGPNGNDAGDTDMGPNDQLNMPVLINATPLQVQGTACAGCTIEVFQADSGAGAYGEGRSFVGSAQAESTGRFTVPLTRTTAGQYLTATATDTSGNTSEFAANIVVQDAQTTSVLVAADAFTRTLSTGWGSADTGGAYTLSGSTGDFSVANGLGRQRLPTAGAGRAATLESVRALDVDARVRVATDKAPSGGNVYTYLVLRRVSPSAEYRAQLRFTASGTVVVRASRVLGGKETLLGTDGIVTGVTHAANRAIWIRAEVTSTAPTVIRIKAWAADASEPNTWNVSVSDSTADLQQAGAVGVRSYLQASVTNAPVNVLVDDLRVISQEAP